MYLLIYGKQARDAQGTPCMEAKSAWGLEKELNLPRGNIFHNALSWFFAGEKSKVGTWGVETLWERVLVWGSSAKRGRERHSGAECRTSGTGEVTRISQGHENFLIFVKKWTVPMGRSNTR